MDTSIEYAELLCKTNHSFLRGGSHPRELVARAAELGLRALAITDRDGVYGMPKAYKAMQSLSRDGHDELQGPSVVPKLIVGAEVTLAVPTAGDGAHSPPYLTLLAQDRRAYGLLCRILTASHAGKPKGEASLSWDELTHLLQLPGNKSLIAIPAWSYPQNNPHVDKSHKTPGAARESGYSVLREIFSERLFLPLTRCLDGWDQDRTRAALILSRELGISIVATNDVHYHAPERRILQDVITAIREGVTLETAGSRLFSNAERYLKSPREMHALFPDLPESLKNTVRIAESCTFSPAELRYRYPSEWIPTGETASSYLRKLVFRGAEGRYPGGIPGDVDRQLRHELKLIDELHFADYFLTIWEIVEFARERKILCQGRGSAANSVVCYCLGITAIDPVRMNLLFERFISAERGEPPDIDVDFEHERREEVIQHIYEKYGRDRAAMVAAVITYRSRSAIREVRKALGQLSGEPSNDPDLEAKAARLAEELYGFPRHLSIHSGGFTLSADPIIETVPVEPARMEGRTIVQWDKDDLDAIGLLKVDVLALGMLSALRKTMELVNATSPAGAPPLSLATIPADDPATYAMIQKADTVGTFQIESRAQMSMLPRLIPKTFYDLVVQVAIVRPGPIVGKMVHPYLRRRKGLEPVDMPHPALKDILGKTLGVPLFQEQVMKMAIVLAGFTPGEADRLRRAIGAWRSSGSIEEMGRRLMQGLLASGLPQEFVDRVFKQIQGFAEYGFPESHSASFALLAYASAYLKRHFPDAFTCALINSQPMGFYSVHTLVDDAKRHGVEVLPVHPNFSAWDCELERPPENVAPMPGLDRNSGAIRLGFRVVKGLSRSEADSLIAERGGGGSFQSLADFLDRARLRGEVLQRLAMGDAFLCFGFDQRHALWEILAHYGERDLFSGVAATRKESAPARSHEPRDDSTAPLFASLEPFEAVCADYASYRLSTRAHPMQALRQKMPHLPKITTAQARALSNGATVTVAGLSIVRQRPPTAKGTVFATLEDEEGFLDLILHKEVHERYRELFEEHAFLAAKGTIQRDGYAASMLVRSLSAL